jgi:hypothetical protein
MSYPGFTERGAARRKRNRTMTNLDYALAALTAAQDAFDAIASEHTLALAACKRSKSKANIARLAAAQEAFDAGLDEIAGFHDAVETAEVLDDALEAGAAKAAADYAQPSFAF